MQSNIEHVKSAPVSDKPMSMEEKTTLKNNIGLISAEQQKGIIAIVQECIDQRGGEIFEFELD